MTASPVRLSLRRIWAMLLRHLYLFRASWPRLFDLIYWPTVQLVMWGFLQVFLATESSFFAQAAGLFIGAVLLFPNGIVGAVTSLYRQRSRPAATQPLSSTELPALADMPQE